MDAHPSEYFEGDLEAHSPMNPRTIRIIARGRELRAAGLMSWSLIPPTVTA